MPKHLAGRAPCGPLCLGLCAADCLGERHSVTLTLRPMSPLPRASCHLTLQDYPHFSCLPRDSQPSPGGGSPQAPGPSSGPWPQPWPLATAAAPRAPSTHLAPLPQAPEDQSGTRQGRARQGRTRQRQCSVTGSSRVRPGRVGTAHAPSVPVPWTWALAAWDRPRETAQGGDVCPPRRGDQTLRTSGLPADFILDCGGADPGQKPLQAAPAPG